MLTQADICRKYVVPELQVAAWDNEPHSIAEQRFFTGTDEEKSAPDFKKPSTPLFR
jgi:hypothetical protein